MPFTRKKLASPKREYKTQRLEWHLAPPVALETAGVEFIEENGGGPGVRLRKRQPKKS
jgi:hypothetical protein